MADKFDGAIHIDSRVNTSEFKKGVREIEEGAKQLEKKVNEAGKGMESAGKIDTKGAQKALDELASKSSEVHDKQVKDIQDEAALREKLIRTMSDNANKANIGTDEKGKNPTRMADMSEDLLSERVDRAKQALAEMQAALEAYKKTADSANPENAEVLEISEQSIKSHQATLEAAEKRLASMRENKIVVETEVDPKGLESGTEEMKTAIQSFRNSFDGLEEKIREKFNGMFATPKQEAKSLVENFHDARVKILEEFDAIDNTDNVREMITSLEQLRYMLASMGNSKYEKDGVIVQGNEQEEFARLLELYTQYEKNVETVAVRGRTLFAGSLEAQAQAVERLQQTFESFDSAPLEQQEAILTDIRTQIELFPEQINGLPISTENAEFLEQMREKLAELTEAYNNNSQAAANNGQAQEQAKPPYTGAWDAAMQKIQQAPGITQMAASAMNSALTGLASAAGGAMARLSYAIHNPAETANKAFGGIVSAAAGAAKNLAGFGWGATETAIKGIATKAKDAALNLAQMAKGAVVSGLGKLKNAFLSLGKSSDSMGGGMKRNFTTILKYAFGIRSLYMLFRKLRSAITEGFTNLMKYDTDLAGTVNSFKASLSTLKNAFASAVAPIVQAVLPMITQFIDMLTSAVSRVGQLIASLTGKGTYIKAAKQQTAATDNAADSFENESKAAKEAQKTIAGFDDLTILNDNSDTGNSGNKNAGAGAANPGGFETVPVDSQMANLADALKDMWEKADFTELGRKLGEKLRDALNSIPWDQIKEVCARIGKSIATFLNGFLETPGLFEAIGRTLAQALNSAFEFLNAFVTNFHWASLGQAIVDGIIGFLDNIDWTLIQDTFAKLGAGIATTIGQVVSNPELPAKIGQALANVINTAFTFLYNFITTIPWGELGTFIKTGLLSIFNGIDWGLIYATFAAGGRGIGDAINGAINDPTLWTGIFTTVSKAIKSLFLGLSQLVTTIKWGEIGKNIGIGLNAGAAAFPWNEISSTITGALNGAFSLIYNFLTTVDFKSIGESIGMAISNAIHDFDWNTAGAALGAACTALFNFLNGIMETIDWPALGAGVIDAIAGWFGAYDWSAAGEFLSNCITGLLGFLLGAAQQVNWAAVPGQIIGAISQFFSGVNWGEIASLAMGLLGTALGGAFSIIVGLLVAAGGAIYEGFKNIIDGGLQGIIDAIAGIGKWIVEHIFGPFIDGFKSAFGIASPSKAMEPLGGYIIDGLLGGILAPIKGIFKWLDEHVAGPIIGGVKKLFGIGSGKTALEDPGSLVTNGLKKGMSWAMNGISSFIKGTVTDPVEDSVKEGLGTNGTPVTEADGQAVVGGLKNGIGAGASDIGTYVDGTVTNPLISSMQNGLGTNGTPFSNADGQAVVAGLKNGIGTEASGLDKYVGDNISNPLLNGITTPFGINGTGEARQFADYGRFAMESMKKGIEASSDGAFRTMVEIGQRLPEGITAVDYQTVGGSIPDGLESGISNGSYDLETTASDLASSIESPFNNISWWSIGDNIITGISNGLSSGWSWLCDSAWDLANDVFDSACNALGIASPSKEFYWVAEMISAGMVEGLEDTKGDAVEAISSTADAITQEAMHASPIIPIQTALDEPMAALDAAMISFADRIVGGFEAMIAALEALASQAAFTVPQAAMGSIAPYAVRTAAGSGRPAPDAAEMMEFMAQQAGGRITREDLRDTLREMFEEYMQIEFYVGNEQVARAANAGNARLNRRFSPTL